MVNKQDIINNIINIITEKLGYYVISNDESLELYIDRADISILACMLEADYSIRIEDSFLGDSTLNICTLANYIYSKLYN